MPDDVTPESTSTGKPSVSVVMPSFNQVLFLERSIRSVLEQSVSSLELLVMDGGSTDGTQALLARMSQQAGGRLRWWSEADHGPAHAVNKAMEIARGDVIGWLNADDLYTSGAIARALDTFDHHPDCLMIYGHGQHIDECDRTIGDYPTQRPDTPISRFADGCFICQPTVFITKKLLKELGGLDESLETAFDFDWWFRIFKRHQGEIGFVDEVQAQSRLHSNCITLRRRETVIREGMLVIARYLGSCPRHWFNTYADEMLSTYPLGRQVSSIAVHLNEFAKSVSEHLTRADRRKLRKQLKTDQRITLAKPDAYLDIDPDGLLLKRSLLRVRCLRWRWRWVEIRGRYLANSGGSFKLKVISPNGEILTQHVDLEKTFKLKIPLHPPSKRPAYWVFTIDAEEELHSEEVKLGATEREKIACRIDAIRLRLF